MKITATLTITNDRRTVTKTAEAEYEEEIFVNEEQSRDVHRFKQEVADLFEVLEQQTEGK